MLRNPLDRTGVRIALCFAAMLSGYAIAKATPTAPIVITLEPDELTPRTPGRGGAPAPPALVPQAGGVAVVCSLQAPNPSYVCANGYWQPPDASSSTASSGGGGAGRASGCVTAQPANGFTCRNSLWVMSGVEVNPAPAPANTTTTTDTGTPTATAVTGAATTSPGAPLPCVAPRPIVGATQTVECVGGTWVVR